jgi:hypothetical protein
MWIQKFNLFFNINIYVTNINNIILFLFYFIYWKNIYQLLKSIKNIN